MFPTFFTQPSAIFSFISHFHLTFPNPLKSKFDVAPDKNMQKTKFQTMIEPFFLIQAATKPLEQFFRISRSLTIRF
jgi:hypothetical protein